MVNPVVSTLHKQKQLIMKDGGSWPRIGEAIAWNLAPASPAVVVGEPILVNPVIGTAHKQPYQSMIDCDSGSRQGQAVAWYLAPAAPAVVREQVLVNAVISSAHKQEHLTLIDGGCRPRIGSNRCQQLRSSRSSWWLASTILVNPGVGSTHKQDTPYSDRRWLLGQKRVKPLPGTSLQPLQLDDW